ncbi:MAG: hypothetical protein JOZ90_17210 [Alphaproteobacteria bacterium]|nr:hypothetical protein [Alphaproteobacteria bacterium]MBV9371251.1 hypothetical protein [Alphaproteobacteria bacterium]MBV9902810.1 hypothetical protein [Alphaproteobacteria bacterium]
MKSFLKRLPRRALGAAALAGAMTLLAADGDSQTRSSVHPYLEIQQVATADFNGGDVLTYTGIGGGIDATIQSRRVTATIAYDYQHRIAWNRDLADDDVHTGLAAVHIDAVPGLLALDAAAVATRTHADIGRPVPGLRTGDDPNVAEVYSAYAGPTLNTHAGPVAIGAAYRLGYVYVDDHSLAGGPPPAGAPRAERYKSSTVHNATASIGMEPGELPFGWTVGGGWVHEDMDRLDSRYDAKYVRGDVVLPVGSTLALTAGAGYEKGRGSQRDILRDSAGLPVTTPDGRVVSDPSKPRLLTYDESGLIWDAGVIWRPSPRTELQARVGHRYGGTTYTGSLEHKINESYALSALVYDNVSSFGRLMTADLAGVPRSFRIPRGGIGGIGGIGGPGGGCIFGAEAGAGACFDDALQSVDNFNFRNRGAEIRLSGGRGVWSYGIGAGYANRRYFAPPGADFVLHGVTDQSFDLNATLSRRLTRTSGVDFDAYAAWYDSGVAGSDGSFTTGVTGTYYRSLYRDRLQGTVSAGVYTTQAGDFDSTAASILVGLRYSF